METETPSIRAIHAGTGRILTLTWKNGSESSVDVAKHLADYAVFSPLVAGDTLFHAVKVSEWGWCAHCADDLELSADTLWRLSLEQGGAWLRTWRTERRMTQAEAAKALGVSPRMWRYYEAGSDLLPKTVRLACVGLDAQADAAE